MEIEKEIDHKCPKCKYEWTAVEIIQVEPPERGVRS